MASKIAALPVVTSPLSTDITNIVNSPFTPGSDKQITLGNLLPFLNTIWFTQATWFINSSSGDDRNSGIDSAHALETWGELRRRILAVGGFGADDTVITIETDLAVDDPMIIDWGVNNIFATVEVNGVQTTALTGSFTSAPSIRNASSNTANVITDSAVTSWTANLGINTGRFLKVTSGAANGFISWIAKDLGSHQARVSSFFDVVTSTEVNPSINDTYSIISCPFMPNWVWNMTSGSWTIKNLNLGDLSSTLWGNYSAAAAPFVILQNCAVFRGGALHNFAEFDNCCMKTVTNNFGGTIYLAAGMVGQIDGNTSNDNEDGGEIGISNGTLLQGVGMIATNAGYLRINDMLIFDSPGFGLLISSGGKARIDQLSGANNAIGLTVTTSASIVWTNPTINSLNINGTAGADISFCGVNYSIAQIRALGGLRALHGISCVTNGLNNIDALAYDMQSITKTATNYTVLLTDFTIGVTSTAAARTITLPSAAIAGVGHRYIIKDESGGALINNITVASTSGNIDGSATFVINTNYGSITVYSDGTNWFIV